MRMIAALMIAFLHAIGTQVGSIRPSWQHNPRLLDALCSGVDIFFVLSGFIIAWSAGRYLGGNQCFLFLKKRFIRLNPVYYLATLLSLAVNWHYWWTHHLFPGPPQFLKSILLLPLTDANGWTKYILMVAWTLSFEWLFYILFALTILLGIRKKGPCLVIFGLMLIAGYYALAGPDYRVNFITNPILLEFLLGIVVYELYSRWTLPVALSAGLITAGVAGYVCQLYFGPVHLPAPSLIEEGSISLYKSFTRGVPAACLLAGFLFLEEKGKLRVLWESKLVQLLGDASYSIYLTHLTIYNILEGMATRLGPPAHPDLSVVLWFLIAVPGGVLFYYVVEVPLLRALRTSRFQPAVASD